MKQIVARATNDLIPYARNARTHSAKQVGEIAASIKEFGFTNPVLIKANNEIIAGHGRVLAAQKLKLKEVPCIVLDHLTDIQAKAYVLVDNQLALNAGWDEDMLALELEELKEADFDLGDFGFEDIDSDKNDEDVGDVEDEKTEFLVVIECMDENEQRQMYEELSERKLKCKIIG